jgi:hypothetical protein
MNLLNRWRCGGLALLSGLLLVACGGSGGGSGGSGTSTAASTPAASTPAASNVVSVTVDGGPDAATAPAVNTLYTTVTVCVPGSSECQTIDHIQVDTQSYGLRILASVLSLNLTVATASDGNSLVECTQFVDGYSWGPVATADIQIAGETAHAVPVQVIGASNFSTVPAACSSIGSQEDTVAQFGANGIVGIGVFQQDCGSGCASSASYGFYYSCTATACTPITVPVASQVTNPVPLFTTDNNGIILDLPSVAADGAATVTGSLIFGIDTESNNASGTQTVLTVAPSTSQSVLPGELTATFGGRPLVDSFIDSGSNGIFFTDGSIPVCKTSNFYCPTSTLNLSVTFTGFNGVSSEVAFDVANADTLFSGNSGFTVLPTLGGTYSSSDTAFDFGLPFFFGRRVASALEGYTTSAGTGPYIAF